MAWFLHRVAYLHPGQRLILKSPPHMARIPALLRQFPNARFVHISRDPYRVYASTVRLWKALSANHSLQVSDLPNVDDNVSEAGQRLQAGYEAGKDLIPKGRLFELRYEDLVADPIGRLQDLYQKLDLGEFFVARSHFEEFLAGHRDYQPTNGAVSDEVKSRVDQNWNGWVKEFAVPASPPVIRHESLPPLANIPSTGQLCTT